MDKNQKKCVTSTLNLLSADVPHKYAHNCTESEWVTREEYIVVLR